MENNRRALLGALAVASFGIPLAACSSTQVSQLEATVTDIINKVQVGVVAAVTAGCAWAGKVVPQAQSVMQEVVAALGNPVAVILEGTAASVISLVTGAVQASVDSIAAAALKICPPAPAPTGTFAAPFNAAAAPTVKTAKGTVIKFY